MRLNGTPIDNRPPKYSTVDESKNDEKQEKVHGSGIGAVVDPVRIWTQPAWIWGTGRTEYDVSWSDVLCYVVLPRLMVRMKAKWRSKVKKLYQSQKVATILFAPSRVQGYKCLGTQALY